MPGRDVAEAMILKTEMAEGESAAVIGPTRLPASRVASPFRCNRCEPGSLVEPSTTPSSSLSIPVSRLKAKLAPQHGIPIGDFTHRGVELLPDGTFVTTTYGCWTEGEPAYVVSVRFRSALEMLVTLPVGVAASLAASAACQLLI